MYKGSDTEVWMGLDWDLDCLSAHKYIGQSIR